jgi:Flp pilus assembly protein TadG
VFAFFRSRSDGQALIEMALILPALLILFTGIFTFGIAYMNQLTLTHAVGVGAQQLQLIRSSTTDPCQDTFNAIKAAAPTLQSANINMTITMGSNSPINQTSCSGKQTQLAQGTSNTVQASYPCNLAIYGRVFANSCTLSAQVTEFEY